jgi:hypothetical protein
VGAKCDHFTIVDSSRSFADAENLAYRWKFGWKTAKCRSGKPDAYDQGNHCSNAIFISDSNTSSETSRPVTEIDVTGGFKPEIGPLALNLGYVCSALSRLHAVQCVAARPSFRVSTARRSDGAVDLLRETSRDRTEHPELQLHLLHLRVDNKLCLAGLDDLVD